MKPYLKFFLFMILTVPIVIAQYLLLLIHKGRGAYALPYIWQKGVCKVFGIKVKIIGRPYKQSQTIYISNHLSYLDIPVIGSVLRASFVAKKDVESWAVFGFLSKLQQTAFISRHRDDAKQAKSNLDQMLNDGKSLIIFPEGTSTDGREVAPFKSSLFSIAMKEKLKDICVQPITLKMESVDGKEVKTQDDRDLYSWHVNMDTPLGKHLWGFAQSSGAVISLNFCTPIKANEFENRKTLAKACHEAVSRGMDNNFYKDLK